LEGGGSYGLVGLVGIFGTKPKGNQKEKAGGSSNGVLIFAAKP
jgi:hypothetical protein